MYIAVTISLHEDPTFFIPSLARTGSLILLHCHAPAHERSKHAHQFIMFAGTSSTLLLCIKFLYWSILISAYGAGPSKVIGLTEGHGGEQHIFA